MHSNHVKFNTPQFRILSDKQIEELHFATLQILERTGVDFECQEAIEILGDAGADVSNPGRVKIPSYLVEQAVSTAPKTITLYSREGEPALVLNGQTGSHFGATPAFPNILDPYTKTQRQCYVEDIADHTRVIDALPNMEWVYGSSAHPTVPADIADKVTLLQEVLNSSKPLIACMNDLDSLREMIDLCSIIAGDEEQLRKKPFFIGTSEPVSPLAQEREAMETSLLCAEKGIPNIVYGMPIGGASVPATHAANLAIANAEILSQLVVIQLKNPGAPFIFGAMPGIMDMKTTIYAYDAPELVLMVAALTELSHYYGLPMFGTAGCSDADRVGVQAATAITHQVLFSMLTGADLVHDTGVMYHATMISAEIMVLVDEIIEMAKVLMGGIEINDETLPLDLIERLGPKASYLAEAHTFKHFRRFWVPTVFDRSFVKKEGTKNCEQLLNDKTIEILKTHQPKPLPEDVLRELKKVEKTWLDRVGLREYPKRN